LPEHLAPGVFVEETTFAGHTIAGVSTSTAGFVGLTEKGAIGSVSAVITSYAEFERDYGSSSDLVLAGRSYTNYMAHAVRLFFDNGGKRLVVVRVNLPQLQAKSSSRQRPNLFVGFFRRILQSRLRVRKAPTATYREALQQLENATEVSIIAAPSAAHSFNDPVTSASHLHSVNIELIAHAEKMQHRIAVLDPPANQSPQEVATIAGVLDSSHAALYYPWLEDASSGGKFVPPSGAVCGIYARTDNRRGVWKAPANVTISGITGFERDVRDTEFEMLNPVGVNVLRQVSGRGLRLMGARTLSSDPEWRYVPVRRYLSFLENSISEGLAWTVFEPNGEALWAECKNRIEVFLSDNWRNGALQGQTTSDAFFVRCDRTTMTQSDIDNGRLIAQVGVAVIKPAEFHIFKITKHLSIAE